MQYQVQSLANYWLRYGPFFKNRLKKIMTYREMDNTTLLEIQNEKFLKLFRCAIKHSKFYKELYAAHDISESSIQSILDIKKLPIISKNDVRSRANDIFIGNRFGRIKSFTSGTTGTPLMVYRKYSDILEESAYLWSHRYSFGYKQGMKTVSLRGDLGRNETERYDKVSNTLYLSSYNLKEKNTNWYFEKIAQFNPYAILAYPSSVENLSNLMLKANKELHVPYIFTSSETLYENQRLKIEETFNTKIYDWYGNAERSIAIEQREDNQYYELPTYSYNEYLEDYTLTTGLINYNFPLIRYEVTDIIKKSKYSNDDDKDRFKIEEISGRNDDMLLLPDGTKIGRLSVAIKYAKNIELAQFVQNTPGKFILNLVVTDKFTVENKEEIKKVLEHRLGDSLEYEIKTIDKSEIIRSKSGKFKLVINKVLADNV